MAASLPDESALPAPYLLWPTAPLAPLPHLPLPAGYAFRSYHAGDEQALFPLFDQEGWHITAADWHDYLERVLPHGLFMLWHTTSNTLVGTAGAIHNPRGARYSFPFGGALAYLVVHPDHRGHGLGLILSNRVVQRFLSADYDHIWVGVQGFRLPAIKTYLKLGFVPLLHQDGLSERWQRICTQLGWPYTPEQWPTGIG